MTHENVEENEELGWKGRWEALEEKDHLIVMHENGYIFLCFFYFFGYFMPNIIFLHHIWNPYQHCQPLIHIKLNYKLSGNQIFRISDIYNL